MASNQEFPKFKYYPDPIANESVVQSDLFCDCCKAKTGFIYEGPFYSTHKRVNLCPWCIADGSAGVKYDCEFTSIDGREVSPEVYTEVTKRTPGFTAWQDPEWQAHCGDGCAYLGMFGQKELRSANNEIKRAVRLACQDLGGDEEDREELFEALDINDGATAYVFKCLHCRSYLSYIDFT